MKVNAGMLAVKQDSWHTWKIRWKIRTWKIRKISSLEASQSLKQYNYICYIEKQISLSRFSWDQLVLHTITTQIFW